MDFISLYKAIPNKLEKRKIRRAIVESCQIQPPTFYQWILRGKIPFLAQNEIAKIMDMPKIELFPVGEEIEC